MDTPSASDILDLSATDRAVDVGGGTHPSVAIGFQVSGGNRHAYMVTANLNNTTTSIDVVVATDGLQHLLQGVVNGHARELWLDGVMIGSATASANAAANIDFLRLQEQRGVLASLPNASQVEYSNCPADFPA